MLLPEGSNSTHVGKFADALLGGLYVDSRFKTGDGKPKPLALEKVEILGCSSDGVDAAVTDAGKMVRGVTLCKDLVASPPNYCTPSKLADVAKEIAKETGLECKILEKDECEKLGMGSYLAVARGSTEPPKFIHLTYKPSGETKKTVTRLSSLQSPTWHPTLLFLPFGPFPAVPPFSSNYSLPLLPHTTHHTPHTTHHTPHTTHHSIYISISLSLFPFPSLSL